MRSNEVAESRPLVGATLGARTLMGMYVGAGAGILTALGDFGASWLWLPWWTDRLELLARLLGLQAPLGAILGAALALLAEALHRAERRLERDLGVLPWLLLAAPGLAWIAPRLFEGGAMSRLPAQTALQTLALLALLGGTYAALRMAQALGSWGQGEPTRRRVLGALALLLHIGSAKLDQIFLPKLYDYLHAALSVLSWLSAAAAIAMLIPRRFGPPKGALGRPTLALLSGAVLLSGLVGVLGSLHRNQNVRVALFEARASSSRSLMLGLEPLLALAFEDHAPAEAVARARAAREERRRALPADGLPRWPEAHLLLVTVDALRADHLGTYGYERPISPHLDAFAASATVFEHAYAQAPHSSYSLCSLMVSEYLHETVDLHLPLPEATLPTTLAAAGYHTAGFYTQGIFHTEGERLARYHDDAFGFARHDHASMDAETRTDRALEEVDRIVGRGEPPSFLWVHYFDVHEPYEERSLGDSEMDRYDGEIRNVDAAFQRLIDGVEARFEREIIVAVTADHGEEFRDHGGVYHGSSLFEEQVRVPLILRGGDLSPRRVSAAVELVDLAPTLLGMLDLPPPASMRGDDLRVFFDGSSPDLGPAFSAVSHKRMVVRWPHKLIADLRFNLFELYDLEADPLERMNLAELEGDRLDSLRGEVYAWLDNLGGPSTAQADPAQLALDRGRLGDRRAVGALATLIADEGAAESMRLEAGRILGKLADANSQEALVRAMGSARPLVAAEAAIALGRQFDPRARDALRALVHAESPELRTRAGVSLGRLRDPEAVPALLDALHVSRERYEREEAVRWLGRLGDPRAVEPLIALLPEFRVRYLAVVALGDIGDTRAFGPLAQMLEWETHSNVRDNVARALGQLGDPRAIPLLVPVALRETTMRYMAEALVRLDAIGVGAIGGADLRANLRGIRGLGRCEEGPERHDWNYLNRTWCRMTSHRASLPLRVPEPVSGSSSPNVALIRMRRIDASTPVSVRVTIGGHPLEPIEVDGRWIEARITLPPGPFEDRRARFELEDEAARLALDHVLLLPGDAGRLSDPS
ncbi:MAG: HEAT repeat domain-containing protein [Myxococcales bacterium]|nr:HEAT repeat domain-containing protein [Myxococcales bacterium]